MTEELFVQIALLDSEIEARLLEGILEDRGIAYAMRSYHDTAYDGLFQVQQGWGALRAREADREQILDLLREIRSQQDVPMDDPEA